MKEVLILLVLAYAGTVYGFVKFIDKEREGARSERAKLLDRIQHPEVLPVEDLALSDGTPKHITVEDDNGFKDYYESVGS
jgi:hypothetical protein